MIFDEPTVGVDIASREELWRAIRDLARNDRVVIAASAEFDELTSLCQSVVCLFDGRVQEVLETKRHHGPGADARNLVRS